MDLGYFRIDFQVNHRFSAHARRAHYDRFERHIGEMIAQGI
jgi:hypothetical protein